MIRLPKVRAGNSLVSLLKVSVYLSQNIFISTGTAYNLIKIYGGQTLGLCVFKITLDYGQDASFVIYQ